MPPAAAFDIVGGEGYFVKMSGPATVVLEGKCWESPFSMPLVTGYNMIGIPVNDTSVTNASSLIDKIGTNCTEVLKWDGATQSWKSYNPSMPPAAAFDIVGGEGYFVVMTSPASITFDFPGDAKSWCVTVEGVAPEVTITYVTKKQDGSELKGVGVFINDIKKGET
jgi:hypothetical protein